MVSSIAEAPTIPLSLPTIVNITNETEVNLAQQGNATSLPPVSMGKFQKEKMRCWLFSTMYFLTRKKEKWNTVRPRLTATSVIQSPRYYNHFFWLSGKNQHTFPCKKNPR